MNRRSMPKNDPLASGTKVELDAAAKEAQDACEFLRRVVVAKANDGHGSFGFLAALGTVSGTLDMLTMTLAAFRKLVASEAEEGEDDE